MLEFEQTIRGEGCHCPFDSFLENNQMHETMFRIYPSFHYVMGENTNWGDTFSFVTYRHNHIIYIGFD